MLSRLPWTPAPEAKPSPARKMTRDRQRVIRERIVEIMRSIEPTAFAAEGPCRHGVRASLCLQGWKWMEADSVAAEIVSAALNIVGAKRPSWWEGQPEYTQPGMVLIERLKCVRCGTPLTGEQRKFCSALCAAAHHQKQTRDRDREEYNLSMRAWWAAWKAKQPERRCEGCGTGFRPGRPDQRFCCRRCVTLVYGGNR